LAIGDHFYAEQFGEMVASNSLLLGDNPNLPIFDVALNKRLNVVPHALVENQVLKIMDWTPNLTLTMPGDWQFDPADLLKLCVRSDCP
jgi:hypothetical protein